jgi:hypothetical protein
MRSLKKATKEARKNLTDLALVAQALTKSVEALSLEMGLLRDGISTLTTELGSVGRFATERVDPGGTKSTLVEKGLPLPPKFSPTEALNLMGEERDILIHMADQESGVPSVVSAVSYLYSTSPDLCQKVAVVRIELFVCSSMPQITDSLYSLVLRWKRRGQRIFPRKWEFICPQGSGTIIKYDGEYTASDLIDFIACNGSTHSDASALALKTASEQLSAITEDAASLTRFVNFAGGACHLPSKELLEILRIIKEIKAKHDLPEEPTKDGAFSTIGKGLGSLLLQYAVQVAAQLTADAI